MRQRQAALGPASDAEYRHIEKERLDNLPLELDYDLASLC